MIILVLRENPGMDFTKVSKELARSWACLSVDEKERYKHLSNEQKNVVAAKTSSHIQPEKKMFQFTFKNLKRHSTLINIDLTEIRRNIFSKPSVL